MSKLLTMYNNLKEKDSDTLYLFKIGLFYNFLNNDAITVSNLLNLKITNLSPTIIKCGFPSNSLEKYIVLFNNFNLYKLNSDIKNFCNKISCINIESLSVQEAYNLLEELKMEASNFLL